MTFSGNGDITFSGNYATSTADFAYGGAIHASSSLTFRGNGDITFSGNYATSTADSAWGGAIVAHSSLPFSGNGMITFRDNYVRTDSGNWYAHGGAIFLDSGSIFILRGAALFERNYEVEKGVYRLRSVYQQSETDEASSMELSAQTGKSITFKDGVYAGSDVTVTLNKDYVVDSVTQKADGDILLSGATMAEDLKTIKEGVAATADELSNSLSSELLGTVTLHGGRLRVEDGVKLTVGSFSTAEGSNATLLLKDARVTRYSSTSTLSLSSGSTLALQGMNTITANSLTMADGTTMAFTLGSENIDTAVLTLDGILSADALTVNLTGTDLTTGSRYRLITVSDDTYTWDSSKISVSGLDAQVGDLTWSDGTLYFNYGGGDIPILTTATWSNGSSSWTWDMSSENWTQDGNAYAYKDGVDVVFGDTGAGTVTLVGTLAPKSVLVNSSADYTWTGDGKLSGSMTLTKQGTGKLTIETENDYTGGTTISGGTVVAAHASALGTGSVQLNGGTLRIEANALLDLTASGNGRLEVAGANDLTLRRLLAESGELTIENKGGILFTDSALTSETQSARGGAAFLSAGVTFDGAGSGDVRFSRNSVSSGTSSASGGAIFSVGDMLTALTFSNNSSVSFVGNHADTTSTLQASAGGGAISFNTQPLVFSGNTNVTFRENYVNAANYDAFGGALTSDANLTLSNNGTVQFIDNHAYSGRSAALGGAVYSYVSELAFSGNTALIFKGNYVESAATADSTEHGLSCKVGGGAIGGQSTLTFSQNTSVSFDGNYAKSVGSSARGGAIDTKQPLTFSKNGGITFSKNYASSANDTTGGAIRAGSVTFNANTGDILFSENKLTGAAAYGGAIIADSDTASDISFTGNKNITFNANSASGAVGSGGAIAIGSAFAPSSVDSSVDFSSNNNITFTGNNVSASGSGDYDSAAGGAISAFYLTFSGNKAIEFSSNYATSSINGNSVSARGGAIYAEDALSFSGNEAVNFSGNYASSTGSGNDNAVRGGALYLPSSSELIFSGNGMVTFSGNSVRGGAGSVAEGGAIYLRHGSNFVLRGAASFERNYEVLNGTYRLRSVYQQSETGEASSMELSAQTGKSITFKDGVYAGSDVTVSLNKDYDVDGVTQKADGDILFSGAGMADTLKDIKGGVEATADELANSLSSELLGAVTLHGGRLRVEDGVKLTVGSFSAASGRNAALMLKNASVNGADTEATISLTSGSTLGLQGVNSVTAKSLTLEGGSFVSFVLGSENADTAVLTLGAGTALSTDALTVNLSGTDLTIGNRYKLITTADSTYTWDASKISVRGLEAQVGELTWSEGTLYFNYRGGIIPELATATWSNGSNDWLWNVSSENWMQDGDAYAYKDGVDVVFGDTAAGTVTLEGTLAPKSVLVNSSPDYTWTGSGKLSGGMTLTKQGTGKLTIETSNDYTGGTTISGGTLVAAHASALGTGGVQLNGGALQIAANGVTNTISSAGTSYLVVDNGYTLDFSGVISNAGTLTLSGSFDASALTKTSTGETLVDVTGREGGVSGFSKSAGYTVQVVNGGTLVLNGATVKFGTDTLTMGSNGIGSHGGGINYGKYTLAGSDAVSVSSIHDYATESKNAMVTQTGGTLTVDEDVQTATTGGSILLTAGAISGSISGTAAVEVRGSGSISGDNSYTGGTTLTAGTLTVGSAKALGTGRVSMSGGALNLGGLAVANDITATGGTLNGAAAYTGRLTVQGGLSLGGATQAGSVTLSSGTLRLGGQTLTSGTMTLSGGVLDFASGSSLEVTGALTLGGSTAVKFYTATAGTYTLATVGSLSGNLSSLTLDGLDSSRYGWSVSGNKLLLTLLTAGSTAWDSSQNGQDMVFNGGEDITIIGDVKPGSVVVDGSGTTTWNGPGSIAGDTSVIKNGSGTLVVNNENTYTGGTILNDGKISVNHDNALGIGTITMNGGTLEMNGHDLSKNDVVVKSGCTLDAGNDGKVKTLTLDQPRKVSPLGNEYFDAATGLLTLKGDLIVKETLEVKHGVIGGKDASITAGAVAISGGTIDTKLLGTGGVTKTGSGEAKILGNQSYTGLTHVKGGTLSVYGSLDSDIKVDSGARLRLEGAFNGADMLLAQGARLVTKSGLSIGRGQNLSCSGTIVGDLTLAGGTVTATPGDFLSITGTLTLASDTRLVLSGSGWGAGSYDLFQFKNLSGSTDYATFFGLTDGSIAKVGDKLVLTLTQAPSSTLSLRTLGSSEDAKGTGSGTAVDGNALLMSLREALRRSNVGHVAIQSTWSAAAAQREFSDLLRQRRLQGGTGTAWVSMLGGHSRMSGTGGSDVNRMGGALGVELTVSESGNIGLAAGSTWSRLNPENHGRMHQNAQSVGLYGNAKLFGNATDSVWLSWDAAYGRTRTHGPVWNGSESWTQQSAVLATRATWARMIGQNTAVQGFGGLEYLALDSAKVQGERTGSVQNLRGEIGAGITHNAGRASVYAEAALVGDMLRHNPVTTFDGIREQGLNPGRVGLKVSVGGSYRLNDTWSANAAYTLEAAEHNTQHSANIGVSYTF
ncbi:MAG: autotransporter-associated beta strand repeat-containing protein [Akkermansia sp.]|nr:autotransporter-associated beta strand repeat-containing protein [Akkermansia sp.]